MDTPLALGHSIIEVDQSFVLAEDASQFLVPVCLSRHLGVQFIVTLVYMVGVPKSIFVKKGKWGGIPHCRGWSAFS